MPDSPDSAGSAVEFVPLSAETWPLFERLFGPGGVQGGCWCSSAPRPRTGNRWGSWALSRVMASDEPGAVWSVTCFYLHRRGLATALLRAAVDYAAEQGAESVEGYPVSDATRSAADLYHGTTGMFTGAGFEVVEKRGPARALVRRRLPVAR